MSKLLILFLISFLSINCIEEDKKQLNLNLEEIKVKTIGKKGTVILSFKKSDEAIEFQNTKKEKFFESKIVKDDITNNVDCGLWSVEKNLSSIYVFCNIEEKIPSGNYSLLLNEVQPFDHENYHITLNVGETHLQFEKVDKNIIDLYSEPQEIIFDNVKESYELKFNIVSYNQEILKFNNDMFLECKIDNNILKCPFTKKDLIPYLTKDESFSTQDMYYLDTINYDENKLYLVASIKIIIKDIQRKDVFVGIKKLLVDTKEESSTIAYETNVTDISNFYRYTTGNFRISFMNKNKEGVEEETIGNCNFLKYDNNPLYLVCDINGEGTNWLKKIEDEKKPVDKNIFYDYRIQPVENEEKINNEEEGSFIYWHYPKVLDFTKNNGPLNIIYKVNSNKYSNGFTYNENIDDLKCQDVGTYIKKCEITKEHFKGKKNGDYFLKHTNHLNKKSTNYEIPPIKVILEAPAPSKGNIISLSLFYSLVLLLIMI